MTRNIVPVLGARSMTYPTSSFVYRTFQRDRVIITDWNALKTTAEFHCWREARCPLEFCFSLWLVSALVSNGGGGGRMRTCESFCIRGTLDAAVSREVTSFATQWQYGRAVRSIRDIPRPPFVIPKTSIKEINPLLLFATPGDKREEWERRRRMRGTQNCVRPIRAGGG